MPRFKYFSEDLTFMAEKITKDMLIGDVLAKYPELISVFLEEGFQCAGCQAADFETIEQGLSIHGRNKQEIDNIIKKLNKAVSE